MAILKDIFKLVTGTKPSCDSVAFDLPEVYCAFLGIENFYTVEDANSLAGGVMYKKIACEKKRTGHYALGVFGSCEKYDGEYAFELTIVLNNSKEFVINIFDVSEIIIPSESYSPSNLTPLILEIDKHIRMIEFNYVI